MKYLLSFFVLFTVIIFSELTSLAQFFYPDASMFNPSAHLLRGDNQNLKKWLKVHEAAYFASLIDNHLESEFYNKEKIFSIFVPLDKAFDELSGVEQEIFSDTTLTKKLIKYHILPNIISEDDIRKKEIITSEGSSITIVGRKLDDQSTTVILNDQTKIQKIAKISENLVIILIDKILIPPDLSK